MISPGVNAALNEPDADTPEMLPSSLGSTDLELDIPAMGGTDGDGRGGTAALNEPDADTPTVLPSSSGSTDLELDIPAMGETDDDTETDGGKGESVEKVALTRVPNSTRKESISMFDRELPPPPRQNPMCDIDDKGGENEKKYVAKPSEAGPTAT
jgi:hypothetical protein